MWRLVLPVKNCLGGLASIRSASVAVIDEGSKLQLRLDDEPDRRFHSVWLRHNCRCTVCLSVSSDQNIVHHSQLVDVVIKDAKIHGMLEI